MYIKYIPYKSVYTTIYHTRLSITLRAPKITLHFGFPLDFPQLPNCHAECTPCDHSDTTVNRSLSQQSFPTMPPHAALFAHDFVDEPHSSIEVVTNAEDGKLVVSKIVVVETPSLSIVDEYDDDDDDDDIVLNPHPLVKQRPLGREENYYDNISDHVMNACGACPSTMGLPAPAKPRKSALKKPRTGIMAKSQMSRNVSFDALKIREYSLTLGDHPSACTGPPMTLDWSPMGKEKVISLDKYERARQPRRSRKALKMSYQKREAVLEQQGFTMDEVKVAWEESLKVRKQRRETIIQGAFSTKVEEACQSAARKFWRTLNLE